jgi:predicted phage terminase large subunit-like protein
MNILQSLDSKQLKLIRYINDPVSFMTELLGLSCEPFHQEWLKAFEENKFVCLLAPRGHGKTTAVGSYILWRICKNRHIRILIATINQDKANSMMTFVQEHLSKNTNLIDLFGDFKGQTTWSRDQIRVSLNDTKFTFYNEPTLKVLGVNSRIISAHYDLIILDDITDNTNSKTEHQRRELEDWYNGPLVGTFLSNTNLINIGTKWHEDDIHTYLANKAGFKSLRYQALLQEPDENGNGARVLWPDHLPWDEKMIKEINIERAQNNKPLMPEDSLTLKFVREHQGELHFQMQYQNEIIASGISKIKPEWVDKAQSKFMKLGGIIPTNLKIFMGVDFGGEDTSSDYFAISVVGVDSDANYYVLDNYRTHASLHRQIEIIKAMDEKWHPSRVGIEAVSQQKMIVDDIIRGNPSMPVIPIKSSIVNDKDTRVDRLSILFETNRIALNPIFTTLADELVMYPRARNDDCLDSLSFAIQTFESSGFIDYSKINKYVHTNTSYKMYKI